MNYQELKAKHRKSIDEFPIRFAFSDSQLQEVLEEWQVDKDELCGIGGGGIVRKDDGKAWVKLMVDMAKEQEEAQKDDEFLTAALEYELANHEYGYTYDSTSTLESLGLEFDSLTDREMACLTEAKSRFFAANC